jgi:hypothetical protein
MIGNGNCDQSNDRGNDATFNCSSNAFGQINNDQNQETFATTANTCTSYNSFTAPSSSIHCSRPITFDLGDGNAAAADDLNWDDYAAAANAFQNSRPTTFKRTDTSSSSPAPPRAASPTHIAALAELRKRAANNSKMTQQEIQDAKARGAKQRAAAAAALSAKTAAQDALVKGLKSQQDVDEY